MERNDSNKASAQARALSDENARAIHAMEQDGVRAKALGGYAAQFWKGLCEGGVPEIQASFMTNEYIKNLLQLGRENPPKAEGGL